MAQVATGIVGGAIGFMIGGPTGALYGAQIGMMAGSYLFAKDQTIKGPSLGDVTKQYSQEGVPRPITFGTARPIGGNIIYSGKPIIKIKREKVGGGKGGGGSQYQETEEIFRTYAVRICEGPVGSITRIWENNKLVYDSRPNKQTTTQVKNNAKFLKHARLYTGGWDQMPDSALQSEFGVDNVTAHRGTCYMVIANKNMTEQRGAIPQYQFEVSRCALAVYVGASGVYKLNAQDGSLLWYNSTAVPSNATVDCVSLEGKKVAADYRDGIAVLDIKDGSTLHNIATPNRVVPNTSGFATKPGPGSVLSKDGYIYYNTGQVTGGLKKVDLDGNLIWETGTIPNGALPDVRTYCQPVLSADGRYVYTAGDNALVKVNTSDGSLEWVQPILSTTELASFIALGPNGRIYYLGVSRDVGNFPSGFLYKFKPDGTSDPFIQLIYANYGGLTRTNNLMPPSVDIFGNLYATTDQRYDGDPSGATRMVRVTGGEEDRSGQLPLITLSGAVSTARSGHLLFTNSYQSTTQRATMYVNDFSSLTEIWRVTPPNTAKITAAVIGAAQ